MWKNTTFVNVEWMRIYLGKTGKSNDFDTILNILSIPISWSEETEKWEKVRKSKKSPTLNDRHFKAWTRKLNHK